eukprot:6505335-Alexandrium_andersonii.AAC.1
MRAPSGRPPTPPDPDAGSAERRESRRSWARTRAASKRRSFSSSVMSAGAEAPGAPEQEPRQYVERRERFSMWTPLLFLLGRPSNRG